MSETPITSEPQTESPQLAQTPEQPAEVSGTTDLNAATPVDKKPEGNEAAVSSNANAGEEEEEDDGSMVTYKVEIIDALKQEAHTAYSVKIIPSRGKVYTVMHRYSDFHALQEKLVQQYPFVAQYNFPSKKIFNKEKEFIEKRKKDLQDWLTRVIENVNLVNSRDVRSFLEIKDRVVKTDKAGQDGRQETGRDPQLVIDVESTKQVENADVAVREMLNKWREQLRESKEMSALREQLENQLIPEAKLVGSRQKKEILKRGLVVHELVLKGKGQKYAVRLNTDENELHYAIVTGDVMPEIEQMPQFISLFDVQSVLVANDVPLVQKMKKSNNNAVSFALVSNLPEPPVNAFTTGVNATSAADFADCVDGLRAILKQPFIMRSTVEGIAALVYVDVNLRLMELSESEVQAVLSSSTSVPPLPADMQLPE